MNLPPHGDYRRYQNRHARCRCTRCRAAWAAYLRDLRARRNGIDTGFVDERFSDPVHGTRACYKRGCRNPECVEANTVYVREHTRANRVPTCEECGSRMIVDPADFKRLCCSACPATVLVTW